MLETINIYPEENINTRPYFPSVFHYNMIVGCYELFNVYKDTIKPYLDEYNPFIEIEKGLLHELFVELNHGVVNPIFPVPLSRFLSGYNIPTDILKYFYYRLNEAIGCVILNIERIVKNRILVDIEIYSAYTLKLSFIEYS